MLDFILLALDSAWAFGLCLRFGSSLFLGHKACFHALRHSVSLLLLKGALEEGVAEATWLHRLLKSLELIFLLNLFNLVEHVANWVDWYLGSGSLGILTARLRRGFRRLARHQRHGDSVALKEGLHVFDVCCQGQVLGLQMHHVIDQD